MLKTMRKSTSNIFQNERVSASAGAGKTYALTMRYIALALSETLPDPFGILAITFTRKAAGEFLKNILELLSNALLKEENFTQLKQKISEISDGKLAANDADFKARIFSLLRTCALNLNKLKLSTIDSFFSSVLKGYANECGLYSKVGIVDTSEYQASKELIVDEILADNSVDEKTFNDFCQLVKTASFGEEQKSLKSALYENLRQSVAIYRKNGEKWGNIDAILTKKTEFNRSEYEKCAADFCAYLGENGVAKKSVGALEKFFAALPATASVNAPAGLKPLAEEFAKNALSPNSMYGKVPLNSAYFKLNYLFESALFLHLQRACNAAEAARKIAELFEQKYFRRNIKKGRLTFDDITYMLNGLGENDPTFIPTLEYRLDSKIKHYLVDEFQDTSREQWNFLGEILGDVVNSRGEKTFYYVGDVKQSIYSFRNGDRRLFNEVFGNANGAIKDGENLHTSYRSGKCLLNFVNGVFADKNGNNNAFLSEVFDKNSAKDFGEMFNKHLPAKDFKSISQLSVVKYCSNKTEDENRLIFAEILDILRETKPVENKISCAILVNKNDLAEKIIEFLRENEIHASGELEKSLAKDNTLVPLFVQLVKLAFHPSDTAAKEFLKMSPFAEIFDGELSQFSEICEFILRKASAKSFAEIAEFFEKKVVEYKGNALDISAKYDIQLLKEACAQFDNSAQSGIDAFIRFIENKTYKISAQSKVVQVMTIHKSKGLGFDMVILPDLHRIGKGEPPSKKLGNICRKIGENEYKPLTVSYMPPSFICTLNCDLNDTYLRAKSDKNYDNLCLLYVALTRAKRALYAIVPDVKDDNAANIQQLLIAAFNDNKATIEVVGDVKRMYYVDENCNRLEWLKELLIENKKQAAKAVEYNNALIRLSAALPDNTQAIQASKAASDLPESDAEKMQLGILVHKIFENLPCQNIDDGEKLKIAFTKVSDNSAIAQQAFNIVKNALLNPQIAEYFMPQPNTEYFTEFAFDMNLSGGIAGGRIDRLVLKKDLANKYAFAEILDFKASFSNSVQQKTQLKIYANAVSLLFGIPQTNVATKIVDYTNAKVYEI